jgi:hypothetical protein
VKSALSWGQNRCFQPATTDLTLGSHSSTRAAQQGLGRLSFPGEETLGLGSGVGKMLLVQALPTLPRKQPPLSLCATSLPTLLTHTRVRHTHTHPCASQQVHVHSSVHVVPHC